MGRIFRLRAVTAGMVVLLASGCAGPAHVVDIAPHQPVAPASYAFTPLTPNGADVEVRARLLIAAQLAAHGFHTSDQPAYVIDVAVSARPGKMGLFTSVTARDDAAAHRAFFTECTDHAIRLAVIVIERRSGKIVSGARGGQLACDADAEQSLPALAELAVAESLR